MGFNWQFWPILALLLVLVYPLSFGPACWISERTEDDGKILSFVYGPLIEVTFQNRAVRDLAMKYLYWGLRRNAHPVLTLQRGKISKISWRSFYYGKMSSDGTNPLFVRPSPKPYGNGGGFGGGMGGPR